ncbi:MAG: Glycosyl hydrolase family 57 [Syntrophorhabdus sp. PtaU1.Bin058]|nr:MAG: Glycosyl hydrolase family 57 [Syntrophorhabdus sp. PtaU1.Bin058]
MDRYICIHGHFYQPPRENPWLEAVEVQDSAYPYHDWNARINAECYAPNSASRILDGDNRIMEIVSNYSKISFNFGPTLLSWMEHNSPEVYKAILESDREGIKKRSGHGNAIAQSYNHIIMPLAHERDKRTQAIWGIKDFEYRFRRLPEGMWLPETAVDLETLDMLAELGILFVILAPGQASRVRKIGTGRWKDVSNARIDPARAYLLRLASGRKINIFFYDGPISGAVAFEKILDRGEDFAKRLLTGFSDARKWPQFLNIATDGETYGHHRRFGEMALAYALDFIEREGLAQLTNYGEYLAKYPPSHEVQIFENTSWSCYHGIERWRSDCGCSSGGHPGWNQSWRAPLREAFDWLRDNLFVIYEKNAGRYLKYPWQARNDYIEIILDRSRSRFDEFIQMHRTGDLNRDDEITVIKLLEMQRHAMLMYTSCGWFFDELSGIETIQVLKYAVRAIQLAVELSEDNIEPAFLEKLGRAKSNIQEYGDGAAIYERFVKPAMVDLKKVAAHYAVSSVIEEYPEDADVFSYNVQRKDRQSISSGGKRLDVGKITVASKITGDAEDISYCMLYLGGHIFNGGVRSFLGDQPYSAMKRDIASAFEQGDVASIIHLMDTHFGMHNYSLAHLFLDKQREVLRVILRETIENYERVYQKIFDSDRILMGFLQEAGLPVPKIFIAAAEHALLSSIKNEFQKDDIDLERIGAIVKEIKKWKVSLDPADAESIVRRRLEGFMTELAGDHANLPLLMRVQGIIALLKSIPVDIDYWTIQNIYYRIAKGSLGDLSPRAANGDKGAEAWVEHFRQLGELIYFNVDAVLHKGSEG